MSGAFIIPSIFCGSVAVLVVIGGTILLALKILKGGVSNRDRKWQADEAKMIQEMYRGLNKMESRIESLETILLDKKTKESSHAAP